MSNVRLRRLQADFERLTDLTRRHPRLSIVQAVGEPPDRYQIKYRVRSLRKTGGELLTVDDHLVEISLPAAFPRTPPLCRMLTPVFHPNIAPHAICIGDHWSPGETLSSLVIRIAEMLAFQSYNTRSPLNGEAAKWVEENTAALPLDAASMTLDDAPRATAPPKAPPPSPGSAGDRASGSDAHESRKSTGTRSVSPAAGSGRADEDAFNSPPRQQPAPAPTPTPVQPAPRPIEFPCPSCAANLRVQIAAAAVRIRCPKCRTIATVTPDGKVTT